MTTYVWDDGTEHANPEHPESDANLPNAPSTRHAAGNAPASTPGGGGGDPFAIGGTREGTDNMRSAQRSARTAAENVTADSFAPQAQYDTTGRTAQQKALQALQDEIAGGGWSPAERQAYAHQSAVSVGMAAGQRAGAVQQMIAKGMSPALANRIASQVGQSQQAQTGYQTGLQAQSDAEQRMQGAEQSAAGLTTQISADVNQENEFNARQQQTGIEKALAARQGQSQYDAARQQQQQQQTVSGITTGVEGALGLASKASQGQNAPTNPKPWEISTT